MIRAVIFDVDGTIVDSIDGLWQAFNVGVASFKLEPVAKERLLDFLNRGIGLADILVEIYPELGTEPKSSIARDIMAEMRKEYLAGHVEEARLSRGVTELLAILKTKGFKMGVVTSRTITEQTVWQDLARLQVAHFIGAVTTADQLRRKPAPDGIIECLKRLEVLPEECLYIGDAQVDMRAGRAAGVKTVAVAAGVSARAELEAESPDFIFDDLPGFTQELDFILSSIK